MVAVVPEDPRLYDTEGFVVESSEGDLGWVEEVWVGDANEPRALAVRTAEGRHGLLLGAEVLAVDRENHWVVVPPRPALLELARPRLVSEGGGGSETAISASWATTGEVLHVAGRAPRPWRLPFWRRRRASGMTDQEPQLWRAVTVLLTSIALLVALVIALAFVVARLVTGAAY
jgi:hypothetical protein